MGTGLLDFFALEASEYTEQLDGAVVRAAGKIPDLDIFTRNARALRGSATMARIDGIAKVATGLERLGRGLRDGSLTWSPHLRAALVAAIDDVKILVRAVRTWGNAEDERAAARTAELDTLAPAFSRRSVVTPMLAIGSGQWLASETAEVAAALRRWVEQAGSVDALTETVRRIRSLRGIAALADFPPVRDVVATVDDTVKAIELGTAPTDAHRTLFRTAADVLQEAAAAIQGGRKPATTSAALAAFTAAASSFATSADDRDYVVPIATLFPDSGDANVLHAAANPPTTPQERFRMEAVSQAEHLRRLIADARSAGDGPLRQRAANDVRSTARALQRAAESFGETATARAVQALTERAGALDESALTGLDLIAQALATGQASPALPVTPAPAPAPAPPSPMVAASATTPAVADAPSATPDATPNAPPAPKPAPAATRTPTHTHTPFGGMRAVARPTGAIAMPAPSGSSLQQALESGLSGLARLNDEPMAEPAVVDEDDGVVPIQELLYRGKAALARAIEVGDTIKAASAAPDHETLTELFDLLELAATE